MNNTKKFKVIKGEGVNGETIKDLYKKPLRELTIEELEALNKTIKLGGGLEDSEELYVRLERTFMEYGKDTSRYENELKKLSEFPELIEEFTRKKKFVDNNFLNYKKIKKKELKEKKEDMQKKTANEILSLTKDLRKRYVTQKENLEYASKKFIAGMTTGGLTAVAAKAGLIILRKYL